MENKKAIESNIIVINRSKKILLATGIYPPDIGGPATYAKLLKDKLPIYTKDKIRVIIANFGEVRRWPKVIRHIVYFFKVLNRGRHCDLIYALDPVSVGLPAMLAAKVLGKKFIVKIVGDYAWEQGTQRFGVKDDLDTFAVKWEGYHWMVKLFKKIQLWVANGAQTIIVPSEYLKKIVCGWGVLDSKIQVIYNAFDIPTDIPTKATLREKLKITGRVIISVGRLVPWKGFDLLISLMPDLLKKFPDAKLLIVGDGPEQNRLVGLVNKLDLADSVMLTGRVDHRLLATYIRIADVFALNTRYEGFSHQLLEVAALGTPIITTNVGGNPEIIQDGSNGILVDYNDVDDFLSGIKKILSNIEFADLLTKRAEKTVTQFDEEKMINNLLRVILR